MYLNSWSVAPIAGWYIPNAGVVTPPVPDIRVQVPPDCSLVIILDNVIVAVLLSQTVMLSSTPAFAGATVNKLVITMLSQPVELAVTKVSK